MSIEVVITGGAGRIAYALIPLILSGQVFGSTQKVSLRLLDVEFAAAKLVGIAMEIEDSNYELCAGLVATTDPQKAFEGVEVAILLGGYPRLPGMERKDLTTKNAEGMRDQARDLQAYGSSNVKVLVVANPANTNCLVAMKSAPQIPAENFTCLTRLDQERLRFFVASQANKSLASRGLSPSAQPSNVKGVAIWGNHSTTQVPYVDAATVVIDGNEQPATSFFVEEPAALDALVSGVQNRGAEVMKAQQASSGMSAANAIAAHLRDWLKPIDASSSSSDLEIFSMGILSNGNPYGVPDGLCFSFPLRRVPATGGFEIVAGLPISAKMQAQLDATVEELMGEIVDAATIVPSLVSKL